MRVERLRLGHFGRLEECTFGVLRLALVFNFAAADGRVLLPLDQTEDDANCKRPFIVVVVVVVFDLSCPLFRGLCSQARARESHTCQSEEAQRQCASNYHYYSLDRNIRNIYLAWFALLGLRTCNLTNFTLKRLLARSSGSGRKQVVSLSLSLSPKSLFASILFRILCELTACSQIGCDTTRTP